MTQPIVYIDKSDIREGKLEQVKDAINGLVEYIESHVPRALSYAIYLDETEQQMTVVQVQPDSASMEYHMEVGGPAFAPFKELIRLTAIEVYGDPSDRLHQQLLDKARRLGDGTVSVHKQQAGFARFEIS